MAGKHYAEVRSRLRSAQEEGLYVKPESSLADCLGDLIILVIVGAMILFIGFCF